MGTITVRDVISKIRWAVGDEDEIRETDEQLLAYLNEGQRAAVLIRPEVNPITAILSTESTPSDGDGKLAFTNLTPDQQSSIRWGGLRPGTRQIIPGDNGFVFLSGIRNMAAMEVSTDVYRLVSKRACTPTDQENLDQGDPNWHAQIEFDEDGNVTNLSVEIDTTNHNTAIINYVFDNRNRGVFYNYPAIIEPGTMIPDPDDPSEMVEAGHCYLEIVYAGTPPDAILAGTLMIDDIYEPALVSYMMHKVYTKAPTTPEDIQKSAGYLTMFTSLITGNADQKELELVVRHSPSENTRG